MSSLSSEIARKEEELRVLREKQELAAKKQQIIMVQERQSEHKQVKLARQTEHILEQQAKQQKMSFQKLQTHAQKTPLAKL
jgi:hypothetical protein